MSFMKTQKNKLSGFTLVELLVVISIIGILSSFAVVSLNTARAKARDALRKGDMAQIRTALNIYYDDFKRYPVAANPPCNDWDSGRSDYGAQPNAAGAACYNNILTTALTSGSRPYMINTPKDPKNIANDASISSTYLYRYISNADGSEYAIAYQLEQEMPGVDQVMRGW